MTTRWFFVMTDRNGVSPARVFTPNSDRPPTIADGNWPAGPLVTGLGVLQGQPKVDSQLVEVRNSAFVWPVDPLGVPSTVGPDPNWGRTEYTSARPRTWGGYAATYIIGAESLVRAMDVVSHPLFAMSLLGAQWRASRVRFEWAAWTTGYPGITSTGHRPETACPVLILGWLDDALYLTTSDWSGSIVPWPRSNQRDNHPPRDLAPSRVQCLNIAWTSKSDAPTEALVAAAEASFALPNHGNYYVTGNGGPGTGELYIRSLENAAYQWAKVNVG